MSIDDDFDFRPLKPQPAPADPSRAEPSQVADPTDPSVDAADPESLARLLKSRNAAIERASGMSLPKKTTIDKLTARREALAEARRRVEFKKRKSKSGGLYDDE